MSDYLLRVQKVISLPLLFLFLHKYSNLTCSSYISVATAINAAIMPVVEETARMKKARLTGLDPRGRPTEPSFLRKQTELIGEGSYGGADVSALEAAPAAGSF